jgi:hypothetical protein
MLILYFIIQVMTGKEFDQSSDVYAFAICVWEIFHCRPAFGDISCVEFFLPLISYDRNEYTYE